MVITDTDKYIDDLIEGMRLDKPRPKTQPIPDTEPETVKDLEDKSKSAKKFKKKEGYTIIDYFERNDCIEIYVYDRSGRDDMFGMYDSTGLRLTFTRLFDWQYVAQEVEEKIQKHKIKSSWPIPESFKNTEFYHAKIDKKGLSYFKREIHSIGEGG